MLCIGGPCAGRQYFSENDAPMFRIAVHNRKVTDPISEELGNQPVHYETVVYHRETFHSLDGDLSCWVPAGQNALETMKLLFETYEKSFKGEK